MIPLIYSVTPTVGAAALSHKTPWLDFASHLLDLIGHINVLGAILLLALGALIVTALALWTAQLALRALLALHQESRHAAKRQSRSRQESSGVKPGHSK
jgi:hypothetical protein